MSERGLPVFGGDGPEMVLKAEAGHCGLRLDVFLSRCLAHRSRSQIQRWIRDGRVTMAGEAVKASRVMEVGDEVRLLPPADEHEVVLTPGIVHRLDQHTSGVMVVARSDVAYLDLIRQFKDRRVGKEYLAIVYGVFKDRRGRIRTGIDRHATDRKKMAVVQSRGREAISQWEVEEDFGEASFVRVLIQTGRTHQIRVHFSHLGHPVVGDSTYGGGKRRAQSIHSAELRSVLIPIDRQMLHAWKLSFSHPVTSLPLNFTAEPPLDFSSLLGSLRSFKQRNG